jgi:hypothetical protein
MIHVCRYEGRECIVQEMHDAYGCMRFATFFTVYFLEVKYKLVLQPLWYGPVLPSISVMEDDPNVIGYSERFPHTNHCANHYSMGNPSLGGLGYTTEPRPRLSAGNKQAQVNNKVQRPWCLQDAKTLSIPGRQPSSTRMRSP